MLHRFLARFLALPGLVFIPLASTPHAKSFLFAFFSATRNGDGRVGRERGKGETGKEGQEKEEQNKE